jgi:pimeloyl-ACP methyl ester carboxylesterase
MCAVPSGSTRAKLNSIRPTMPTLIRGSVKIHYEVYGNGPVILLSHGYSSTCEMWSGQIQALSTRHKLILWDMRGHGQSDCPEDPTRYTEDATVADMTALLDTVEAKTAIVGGLSLGGYMSLAFNLAHPERVRALMIIDTGPGFKNDQARAKWNDRAHETAERIQNEGLAFIRSLSKERATSTHRSTEGLVLAARGMLTQRNDRVIRYLPAIGVPTLIVVGADDTPFIAAAEYMAVKIPSAVKVVIPGAGHASNIDQPDIFNRAVLDFLEPL